MSGELTAALRKLADRVALDERDWRALTGARELIALGVAADEARRRRHADRVTFVRVAEVPLVAVAGGARKAGSPAERAPTQARLGELRLTGCPATVGSAVAAVRAVASRAGSVPVTGFALEDLWALCGGDAGRLGDVLIELRDAGLASVNELAADAVADPAPLFAALRASEMTVSRLTSGAAAGTDAHALARRVGSWERAGAVCRSFAPLPRLEQTPPSTGYSDLRQVALARLLVDNIDSIQVDWSRYGPKLAQVALTFGADDVDAVPVAASYDTGWRRGPGEEIRRNIVAAGFQAVARNGRFERLEED